MADDKKLRANIILEVLGRPAEHVKDALNNLVKAIGSEKGTKVLESKVHEPSLAKDSKDLYTTFAEVHLEFDSIANYLGIIFAYMPAHIEIISPEELNLSNIDLNELGNRLILRLHDYDALAKKFLYERKILTEKLMEVAPHLFAKKEDLGTPQGESPQQSEELRTKRELRKETKEVKKQNNKREKK